MLVSAKRWVGFSASKCLNGSSDNKATEPIGLFSAKDGMLQCFLQKKATKTHT
jgi:hypothetical protein